MYSVALVTWEQEALDGKEHMESDVLLKNAILLCKLNSKLN